MDKDYHINLQYDYYQFNGIFYYWLYISFDESFVPEKFVFNLPDKRTIVAKTEATYMNTASLEKRGIESIKGTRAAELLLSSYSAPDFEIKAEGKWHEKLIKHACSYYNTEALFIKTNENPLSQSTDIQNNLSLITDGIVKLLLLRKV